MYTVLLMKPSGPIKFLKAEVETQFGVALRLGWIRQGPTWIPCHANQTHSAVLAAGLCVSACCLHLEGVIGFRYGTGVVNLPGIAFDDTLLLWWNEHDIGQWYHCFIPGDRVLNVPKVTGSEHSSIIQFLMVDPTEVETLRQVAPDIPHLGGSREPDLPQTKDKTNEVTKLQNRRALEDTVQTEVQSPSSRPAKSAKAESVHDSVSQSSETAHMSRLSPCEVQTSTLDLSTTNIKENSEEHYRFNSECTTRRTYFSSTVFNVNAPHVESSGVEVDAVVNPSFLEESPQFEVPCLMLRCFVMPESLSYTVTQADESVIFTYDSGQAPTAVIERTNNPRS